jgi:Grx4 family monothiol glutaredoxin
MPTIELQSAQQLQELGKNDALLVCNFWAEWCAPCQQLNQIFDQLSETYGNDHLRFIKIDAEKVEEVTESFGVSAVPTFLFVRGGKVIEKIEGANGPELATKVARFSSQLATKQMGTTPSPASSKEELKKRLEKLTSFAPIMVFMKGTPSQPQCGFSAKLVDILKKENVQFESFNILSDDEVRQGLKEYSNWPTYPQLYVSGKLIGGLDIVKEMQQDGELAPVLKGASSAPSAINSNSNIPAAASSGNSVPVATTEPQPKEDLNTRLTKLTNQAPVMLFMKGTPDKPQCGFSSKIVDILKNNNVEFQSFNILADEEIRQGLKTFSNWPTYPQLYAKGKLIGGLDIVKELAEEGELASSLQ